MTRRIGVIACSKSKRTETSPAKDLYTGRLFQLSRQVVEATCDDFVILSAHHGVLPPDRVIAPYDRTLRWMTRFERGEWAIRANTALIRYFGRDVLYVVYAGLEYRPALGDLPKEVPLSGMGIGRQMAALRAHLRVLEAEEDGCVAEREIERDWAVLHKEFEVQDMLREREDV